jgi:N-acetylglucosamine kinase
VYIGIDGGATKTRIVVVDDHGATRGEGRSGATNYQIVGVEPAARHLAAGLQMALAAAGTVASSVTAIVAGFAGLDGPADEAAVSALIKTGLSAVDLDVPWWGVNDVVAAWAGALGGEAGAIAISGSGAAALAVNTAGLSAHADGWGHWLGDEGSGFDVGRQGLQAAIRAADGRGPATLLLERLVGRHASQGPEAWRSWVIALNAAPGNDAHAQIASFAPDVVQIAAKGDGVARQILCQAGQALANTTYSTLRRANLLEAPRVATVGSLFVHSLVLRDHFAENLRRLLSSARVQWPQSQPAEGAALLARRPDLIPKDVLVVKHERSSIS